MDYHLDYVSKIVSDIEHKSLYTWCLREFNQDGEQVARDFVPWEWPLLFRATNLRYIYSLDSTEDFDALNPHLESGDHDPPVIEPADIETNEVIHASLIPDGSGLIPTYSMVGSKRFLTDFELMIQKSNQDFCYLEGIVSFTTEIDFRDDTTDDGIQVRLLLASEKFDRLAELINSLAITEASLQLRGVEGFYSNWTPRISTDQIKVLCNPYSQHNLEMSADLKLDPPVLGKVSGFQFRLKNTRTLVSEEVPHLRQRFGDYAKDTTRDAIASITKAQDVSNSPSAADRDQPALSTPEVQMPTDGDELEKFLRTTPKAKILEELYRDAEIFADKNNLSRDDLYDLRWKVEEFMGELEDSFQKDNWYDYDIDSKERSEYYERSWQLWRPSRLSPLRIKQDDAPYVDRDQLCESVASYLELPIRNKKIDRMLVDSLVAAEYIAFGEEMLSPTSVTGAVRSPFRQSHVIWEFLKSAAVSLLVVVGIPIGVLFGAYELLEFQADWPIFVGLGFVVIWVLLVTIDLIKLPGTWFSRTKQKRICADLLDGMATVYSQVGSGTTLSPQFIRELLQHHAQKGVVWPVEVFALLDDIIARKTSI